MPTKKATPPAPAKAGQAKASSAKPKKAPTPDPRGPHRTALAKGTKPRPRHNTADRVNAEGRQLAGPDDTKYVDIKGSKTVQAAWLAAYATCGSVDQACRDLKVYRIHVSQLRDEDPEFSKGYEEAFKHVVRSWENEVARRAFEGHEEKVWHQGEEVGTRMVYSDRLAEFMLKAHGRAELYNPPTRASIESNTNATVNGVIAYRDMSDEDLNKAITKNMAALGILKMGQEEYLKFIGKAQGEEEESP